MRHRWRVSRGLWLKPALSLPHSPACFYSACYFSSTLSASGCRVGQPGSVKLAGVGMREQFARSSQRGSQKIIMGGTWRAMHVVRKNNCCSFKNTALIGFTIVREASRWREAGTKRLVEPLLRQSCPGSWSWASDPFLPLQQEIFQRASAWASFAHSALLANYNSHQGTWPLINAGALSWDGFYQNQK